ncbi:uncharacterized protein LOC113855668 [Abrus precatorius]|uniref:Uncharacterized protein LOC113855668 n=1 Tax=Abrus precatorius TaxID=3816 RepID=A0A8B8KH09_ABRPR|nr:uncharacterized protein LOC113855668 [Abrus precatorius]
MGTIGGVPETQFAFGASSGDSLPASSFLNVALHSMRQQMDESNHEMVNMLTHQMTAVFNLIMETTNTSYQILAEQMRRIADVFGAPQVLIRQGQNVAQTSNRDATNLGRNGQIFENPNAPFEQIGRNLDQNLLRQNEGDFQGNQPVIVARNQNADEILEQAELPRGWKVPKFTKFAGDSGESTVEHIARYSIECGDLARNEDLKLKYFPSSLTKGAFTWFTTLPPNSIHNWNQLERRFHEQFFRGEAKAEKFVPKKIEKFSRKDKVAYIGLTEGEIGSENDLDEEDVDLGVNEVNVAELKPGPPYVCQSLKPLKIKDKTRPNKSYAFDVSKTDHNFDILLKNGQIILSDDHKIPTLEQRKGQKYCKFHHVYGHWTNTCVRFRDLIQDAIKQGRLKFEQKTKMPMKIDSDPMQIEANFVEPIDILMVDVAEKQGSFDRAVEELEGKGSLNDTLEAFEKEEAEIFPRAGDSLLDFLTRKKEADSEVMLCPRCSVVFDKAAAKAFKQSEMKKHYQVTTNQKPKNGQ